MKKRKMILLLCVVVLLFIGILVHSIVGVPKDLRNTLVNYLEKYHMDYLPYFNSAENKIDLIKSGSQPLHVAFAPSDCYFVCGYYNHTHEGNEVSRYCCAKEYTWVKVGSADKIRETYFGKELVVVFQMNNALFAKDLLTDEDYRFRMEHFQIYNPEFEDGVNTNPHVEFAETFIYLNEIGEGNIYCSVKQYDHGNLTFSCIFFEDRYYIPIYTHRVDAGGETKDVSDNTCEFGKYYDAIERIMETGHYSIENEKHDIEHFGLVSVDDFANEIIK